ncbi:MAG: glycosyltransferase [Rhodocyclales bacterium]|nr:glycosyltransferase [Rhodocyclales bacterium]
MTLPLVSIAIPAYRHAKYIETCLASVCAQTYPELELVLIDDGSPDDTFEVASRFLDAHRDRFRRIVLERRENRGVSANSNACIEACSGEWVHLLGSDDRLYPEKVARIQAAIAEWSVPDLALVHTDTDTIDADGMVRPVRRTDRHAPPGPDHAAYRWLFHHNLISNPSIALRRDAFLAIGGFDPTLPLEDIDCWLRLSARYAIGRVPEVLASYRKHPGNSLRQRQKMLGAFFVTYAKFIEANPGLIPDTELRRHFRWYLRRFWNRIRGREPSRLPLFAGALLGSYFRTPRAADYRRFGEILLKAAN